MPENELFFQITYVARFPCILYRKADSSLYFLPLSQPSYVIV